MSTTRWVLIGGGAAIAIYLLSQRKEDFLSDGSKEFREGYTAGFLTPGPFTILAIAGLAGTL